MVTRQLQVERRTAKERWPETDVLPLSYTGQPDCDHMQHVTVINIQYVRVIIHSMWHWLCMICTFGCPEEKREGYQNCSVLHWIQPLFLKCIHLYEQFLQAVSDRVLCDWDHWTVNNLLNNNNHNNNNLLLEVFADTAYYLLHCNTVCGPSAGMTLLVSLPVKNLFINSPEIVCEDHLRNVE